MKDGSLFKLVKALAALSDLKSLAAVYGMNSRATRRCNPAPYSYAVYTGCEQLDQCSDWPESAIDWL